MDQHNTPLSLMDSNTQKKEKENRNAPNLDDSSFLVNAFGKLSVIEDKENIDKSLDASNISQKIGTDENIAPTPGKIKLAENSPVIPTGNCVIDKDNTSTCSLININKSLDPCASTCENNVNMDNTILPSVQEDNSVTDDKVNIISEKSGSDGNIVPPLDNTFNVSENLPIIHSGNCVIDKDNICTCILVNINKSLDTCASTCEKNVNMDNTILPSVQEENSVTDDKVNIISEKSGSDENVVPPLDNTFNVSENSPIIHTGNCAIDKDNICTCILVNINKSLDTCASTCEKNVNMDNTILPSLQEENSVKDDKVNTNECLGASNISEKCGSGGNLVPSLQTIKLADATIPDADNSSTIATESGIIQEVNTSTSENNVNMDNTILVSSQEQNSATDDKININKSVDVSNISKKIGSDGNFVPSLETINLADNTTIIATESAIIHKVNASTSENNVNMDNTSLVSSQETNFVTGDTVNINASNISERSGTDASFVTCLDNTILISSQEQNSVTDDKININKCLDASNISQRSSTDASFVTCLDNTILILSQEQNSVTDDKVNINKCLDASNISEKSGTDASFATCLDNTILISSQEQNSVTDDKVNINECLDASNISEKSGSGGNLVPSLETTTTTIATDSGIIRIHKLNTSTSENNVNMDNTILVSPQEQNSVTDDKIKINKSLGASNISEKSGTDVSFVTSLVKIDSPDAENLSINATEKNIVPKENTSASVKNVDSTSLAALQEQNPVTDDKIKINKSLGASNISEKSGTDGSFVTSLVKIDNPDAEHSSINATEKNIIPKENTSASVKNVDSTSLAALQEQNPVTDDKINIKKSLGAFNISEKSGTDGSFVTSLVKIENPDAEDSSIDATEKNIIPKENTSASVKNVDSTSLAELQEQNPVTVDKINIKKSLGASNISKKSGTDGSFVTSLVKIDNPDAEHSSINATEKNIIPKGASVKNVDSTSLAALQEQNPVTDSKVKFNRSQSESYIENQDSGLLPCKSKVRKSMLANFDPFYLASPAKKNSLKLDTDFLSCGSQSQDVIVNSEANSSIGDKPIPLSAKEMADLNDKMALQEEQNAELKLQLNASQQVRATLELQLRQKEEIIIKSQAETLRKDQSFKQEIKQLEVKLEEKCLENDNSQTKDLQELIKTLKTRESKILSELNVRKNDEQNYRKIMDEYEKTIGTQLAEMQKLNEDHETVKRHLANLELAFSDVHQKYERSKKIIDGYKCNEDALRQTLASSEDTVIKCEEKYESLKAHAKAQIEKSNQEMQIMHDRYDGEIHKLSAIIRRLEIKNASLADSLDQKTKECCALSALCEEVTGKV